MSSCLALSGLAARGASPASRILLLRQLRDRGFACVTVDEVETLQHLQLAIPEARKLSGFRFPPMEEGANILWTETQRQIFLALFRVAKTCLGALLEEAVPNSASNRLTNILEESAASPPFKFHPNEPFQSSQPFAWTFFNLFNYKNGLLNPHVDRSLITVIYSSSSPPQLLPLTSTETRSALWIQDRHGTWHDGDRAAAGDDQVLVMIGEEFQEAGLVMADDDLYPALHAVKVDPKGENLARPHFRPDPAQDTSIEPRISAALILRHDLEQLAHA